MRNAKYLIANATGIPSLVNFLNRRKLLVLAYHGIYDGPRRSGALPETFVHVDNLAAQLRFIKKRYRMIDPEMLLESIENNAPLPARSALITFDDGYESFYRLALPILNSLDIRAIVFVATQYVQERKPFWYDMVWLFLKYSTVEKVERLIDLCGISHIDVTNCARNNGVVTHEVLENLKRKDFETREDIIKEMICLMPKGNRSIKETRDFFYSMTNSQLIKLRNKNVVFGGHTHTHTILTASTLPFAKWDILENKILLEETLGVAIRFFAYPNGGETDFDDQHKKFLLKKGFEAAFSLNPKRSFHLLDSMNISRIHVASDANLWAFRYCCSGVAPVIEWFTEN